jgi:hypothetical protein
VKSDSEIYKSITNNKKGKKKNKKDKYEKKNFKKEIPKKTK